MGGCCLLVLLLLIGPRLFLIGVWLFTNWYGAFNSTLVAILGWIFLPYTSLAWMFIFFNNGGNVEGGYLVLLILAVLFDLGLFSGGHRSMRKR
ncbi:MAG: hypothetical protein ACOY3P_13285 [Planctomycetota bacterium]